MCRSVVVSDYICQDISIGIYSKHRMYVGNVGHKFHSSMLKF